MITFNELLKRAKSEKIAVHTPTEEQAIILLSELDKRGYEWFGGEEITTTHYEDEKENTCYSFYDCYDFILNKQIMYDSLCFYQDEGCIIIECGDIEW